MRGGKDQILHASRKGLWTIMTPFDPRTQEPEDYAIIQRWFIIFDELLFFRSLENYCTLEAVVPGDDHSRRRSCRFKHFSLGPFNYTPDDVRCTIFIYRHHNDLHDPTERLDRYLGTLLHEMAHAVLRIYSCRCRLACYEKKERLVGGHGRAWQHVMANLGTAIPFFLGRDLDLRGEYHLAMGI
jgi:hypothetical protein